MAKTKTANIDFTPLNLEVHQGEDYTHIYDRKKRGPDVLIAQVYQPDSSGNRAVTLALAHQMKAAPYLLEALIEFVDISPHRAPKGMNGQAWRKKLGKAQAAIAKARGHYAEGAPEMKWANWFLKVSVFMSLLNHGLRHLDKMLTTTDTGWVLAFGWAAMVSYATTLIVFTIYGRFDFK